MTTTPAEDVPDIPGGEMSYRPLHFFWILDCSSSMTVKGKISELNFAIRDAIPAMRQVADDNPKASVLVRVLTFSTGAEWHVEKPVEINSFSWSDITADGVTDLGRGFELVAAQLEMPPMPERALPPVLALVSDGQPTDDWRTGLSALNRTPWGKRAIRVAIGIGEDANLQVLQEFLNNELQPLKASTSKELVQYIRWASTQAVRSASSLTGAGTGSQAPPPPPPVPSASDDDDDDPW